MVTELPTFKEYTIDIRLKQFRKADPVKQTIVFLDFNSEEGDLLLSEYIETLDINNSKDKEIIETIFR
jgi:hypothetical protein